MYIMENQATGDRKNGQHLIIFNMVCCNRYIYISIALISVYTHALTVFIYPIIILNLICCNGASI